MPISASVFLFARDSFRFVFTSCVFAFLSNTSVSVFRQNRVAKVKTVTSSVAAAAEDRAGVGTGRVSTAALSLSWATWKRFVTSDTTTAWPLRNRGTLSTRVTFYNLLAVGRRSPVKSDPLFTTRALPLWFRTPIRDFSAVRARGEWTKIDKIHINIMNIFMIITYMYFSHLFWKSWGGRILLPFWVCT